MYFLTCDLLYISLERSTMAKIVVLVEEFIIESFLISCFQFVLSLFLFIFYAF